MNRQNNDESILIYSKINLNLSFWGNDWIRRKKGLYDGNRNTFFGTTDLHLQVEGMDKMY